MAEWYNAKLLVEDEEEANTTREKAIEGFDFEVSDSGATLTITGRGAIPAQKRPEDYPWNNEWAVKRVVKRVIISEGITVLPYGVLQFPEAEIVKLPDSLTTVEAGAFDGMSSLKRLRLGKNIAYIDSNFFCNNHEEIDDDAAFSEIIVSEDNPVYTSDDGILYSKDMKTLIRFPSVKLVQDGTYSVKKGVEKIAPYAFSLTVTGSGLKEIRLPSSVKEIGKQTI